MGWSPNGGASVPTEVPRCGKTGSYNANKEIKTNNNSNSAIKLHKAFKSYSFFCTNRRTGREINPYSETDKPRAKKYDVNLYAV